MKAAIFLELLALGGVLTIAYAAPFTSLKSGPDGLGKLIYWVKCDNGCVTSAQCFKDEAHCGASSDTALFQEAVRACDSMTGLMPEYDR